MNPSSTNVPKPPEMGGLTEKDRGFLKGGLLYLLGSVVIQTAGFFLGLIVPGPTRLRVAVVVVFVGSLMMALHYWRKLKWPEHLR